jgi:hypothetical protein
MTCKKTRSEEYTGGFPPGSEAFENLTDPRTGKAKLPHGTPSDDTFRRIFTALDPKVSVTASTTTVPRQAFTSSVPGPTAAVITF